MTINGVISAIQEIAEEHLKNGGETALSFRADLAFDDFYSKLWEMIHEEDESDSEDEDE